MGTVYRRRTTRPLPEGAEIVTNRKGRFASWQDGKGKTRTAELIVGKGGTDRIVTISPTYTAKYRDGQGIVREVSTGCRDKQAAQSILNDLERRRELVKSNIISATEDSIADHQQTPLARPLRSVCSTPGSEGGLQDAAGQRSSVGSPVSRATADSFGCRVCWQLRLNDGRVLKRIRGM